MKTLNQYMASRIFHAIILAFFLVTSIIMLVDFVETSRNFSANDNVAPQTILLLTALKVPQLIEQTIPFVILFGVMGGLRALNKRSEITVLRAAGLSAWQFLRPAVAVAVLIGIIWMTIINPLSSRAIAYHGHIMSSQIEGGRHQSHKTDIWLREGTEHSKTIIYARQLDPYTKSLKDVTFTVFETNEIGDMAFARRFDAKTATLLPTHYWQLFDVIENPYQAQSSHVRTISWPTQIAIDELNAYTSTNPIISFWHMPDEIKRLKQAGFSNVEQTMKFHKLLALPLTLLAMTLIAAATSMRMNRQGGTFWLMLYGGMIGFAVYFVDNIITAFGKAGSVSVIYAAWMIPIISLLAGLIYLSRIEDG